MASAVRVHAAHLDWRRLRGGIRVSARLKLPRRCFIHEQINIPQVVIVTQANTRHLHMFSICDLLKCEMWSFVVKKFSGEIFRWNGSSLRHTRPVSLQSSQRGADAVRGTENDLQLDRIIVLVWVRRIEKILQTHTWDFNVSVAQTQARVWAEEVTDTSSVSSAGGWIRQFRSFDLLSFGVRTWSGHMFYKRLHACVWWALTWLTWHRSEGTASSRGTSETPIYNLNWCRFSGLEDHVEFSGSCWKYAIDRIKIRFWRPCLD